MNNPIRIYADTAKNVFQVLETTERGRVISNRKVCRRQFEALAVMLPQHSFVYIEACGAMHHWGRLFQGKGHEVFAIPPQHVKPYRRGQKNDANDARAIMEASRCPDQHFVPIKTLEQQDLQMMLRLRERLVAQRTEAVNQLRGFLSEYGIVIPVGINSIRRRLSTILDQNKEKITQSLADVVQCCQSELVRLDESVTSWDRKIRQVARSNPDIRRIVEIPGVGQVIAATIVAKGHNPKAFKNGRDFAASLGLVPRQYSSGGKVSLGSITKGGDRVIRSLLVQGAHAVLRHSKNNRDKTSIWVRALAERKGAKVAAVALANKNARIIWRLIRDGTSYEAPELSAAAA